MNITVSMEIEVPDDATHFNGNIFDNPIYYKCIQVGVSGDHWFYYNKNENKWFFYGHQKPHFCELVSELSEKVISR